MNQIVLKYSCQDIFKIYDNVVIYVLSINEKTRSSDKSNNYYTFELVMDINDFSRYLQ